MTHDIDTSSDEAARAIRAALPAPDDAAIERIAARVAAGSPTPAPSRSPRTRPHRRSVRRWQPALAMGVIVVAAAIATLAPDRGQDGTGGLGPELAAAAVLREAAATTREAWAPQVAGEYHLTTSSQSDPLSRRVLVEERWSDERGAGRARVTERTSLPPGTEFYAPAYSCASRAPAPSPVDSRQSTLEVGSAPPACWRGEGGSVFLQGASGVVVAAPPAGALVDGIDGWGRPSEGRLRFNDEVVEGVGSSDATIPVPGRAGVLMVLPVSADAPFVLPEGTTWVLSTAGSRVIYDGPMDDQVRSPIDGPGWTGTIGRDGIDTLTTDAGLMLQLLRRSGAEARRIAKADADAGRPAGVPTSDDMSAFAIGIGLLTEAPLSPRQRAATFEALAMIAEDRDAAVDQDVELADGRSGTRISFELDPPQLPAYMPEEAPGTMAIVLDGATAQLIETTFDYGDGIRFASTWAAPRRVGSTTTE